ncbi:MAG: hypothetical protein Q7R43_05175 [Candidatus Daviesbacteria bacterium]|nr:hypothetical protein [Candidatus Daviesbacteria bacterium]
MSERKLTYLNFFSLSGWYENFPPKDPKLQFFGGFFLHNQEDNQIEGGFIEYKKDSPGTIKGILDLLHFEFTVAYPSFEDILIPKVYIEQFSLKPLDLITWEGTREITIYKKIA